MKYVQIDTTVAGMRNGHSSREARSLTILASERGIGEPDTPKAISDGDYRNFQEIIDNGDLHLSELNVTPHFLR